MHLIGMEIKEQKIKTQTNRQHMTNILLCSFSALKRTANVGGY
jgi:hypothetical protein